MTSMVLPILLTASAATWGFMVYRREVARRWWLEASNPSYLEKPNLDIGFWFLVLMANVMMFSLVVQRLVVAPNGSADQKVASATESPAAESPAAESSATRGPGSVEPGPHADEKMPGAIEGPLPEERGPADELASAEASEKRTSDAGAAPARAPVRRPDSVTAAAVSLIASLGLLAFMYASSRYLFGVTMGQWGWRSGGWASLWGTLRAGGLAFLLLVPPVVLLHHGLSQLYKYQHSTLDLVEQLKADGAWPQLAWLGFQTAIWTPVVEEIAFRSVIQGFITQIVVHSREPLRWILGPIQTAPARWLGLSAAAEFLRSLKRPELVEAFGSIRFWVPIVVTSLLFALAHYGQGPAPISLYLLSIGLGFLYRTTGNILLCIVVHALLNGLTFSQAVLN